MSADELETPVLVHLDPESVYPVVLDLYAKYRKPPTFFFRVGTDSECRAARREFLAIDDTDVDAHDKTIPIIGRFLVGWHDLLNAKREQIPFAPADLSNILAEENIDELAVKMFTGAKLSALAKKGSGSSPDSSTVSSVATVPAANA